MFDCKLIKDIVGGYTTNSLQFENTNVQIQKRKLLAMSSVEEYVIAKSNWFTELRVLIISRDNDYLWAVSSQESD